MGVRAQITCFTTSGLCFSNVWKYEPRSSGSNFAWKTKQQKYGAGLGCYTVGCMVLSHHFCKVLNAVLEELLGV